MAELWKEVKLAGGNQQLEKKVDGGSAGAGGRWLRRWNLWRRKV